MREFVKGIWVVSILIGFIATPFAWADDRPNAVTWSFRVGAPILTVIAGVAFWRMNSRRDEATDYLSQLGLPFFDRGGFCFALVPRVANGVCSLDAFFQNRFERACRGRIALRPARGFFGRKKLDTIGYEIECGPAAFGVATVCLPLPHESQGKKQKFEVGASVDYPEGRGRMLRFRDGLALRGDSDFGDAFGTAVSVAGALVGTFVLSSPATITLRLPTGVAEELPAHGASQIKTLWQLGDGPLEIRRAISA